MPPNEHRPLVVLADTGGASFHVGDEAMLAVNLIRLRQAAPELEVRVIGRGADRAAMLTALDGAGAVLCSGGGNMSSSWPALLDQRIALFEEAGARGLPTVVTGQTIGPALDDGRSAALSAALRDVALLGVRELPSAALAIELGVPAERVVLQVDDAFGLIGAAPSDAALVEAAGRPFVAVTLDDSFAAAAHVAAEIAAFAAAEDLEVIFLPHEGPLNEVGDLDGAAGRALSEELERRGVPLTLAPVLEPAQTAWMTQRAALVVSSRYHPVVFATAAAVPCVALYRDRYTRVKLEGALTHVGLQRNALATARQRGGLARALRGLWAERDAAVATMAAARPALDQEDERRWGHVLATLGLSRAGGAEPAWPAAPLARAALRAIPPTSDPSDDLPAVTEDRSWDDFARDGFMRLGPLLSPGEVEALCRRADDYALGRRVDDRMQMQLDSGGDYDDLPDAVDRFDEGTSLYRKIQGLESDDLFAALVEHPTCLEICARLYGPHAPLSIFRAMIMNKPAGQGTFLPWHQDGGEVWKLDRDPLVTIWVALDPATTDNGCLEVVPGSHLLGLLTDRGSTLSAEDAERHCPPAARLPLEVEPGHGVLLHNWLIHRSGVNPSPTPRRAFTTCYLDGRTRSTLTGDHFPLVAGYRAPAPALFIEEMQRDRNTLREAFATAEEYARSLETRFAAAEEYALSLQAEVERMRAYLETISE